MPGLLSIGEMGALALHAMLETARLAKQSPEKWTSVSDLADALLASRHTLHKVAKRLVMAGFLESSRGPQGGVRLQADPESLSLLSILATVEAGVDEGGCLFARRVCHADSVCQFCGITMDLERMVHNYFAKTTLADLVRRLATQPPPILLSQLMDHPPRD